MIEIVGYHGTKSNVRRNIEDNGFIESKGGWLGKGVYFFQDDYEMAKKWAIKKHRTIMVCYIKRIINVAEERFFDITWPLDPRTKYFFQERVNYVMEMEKRGYYIEVDDRVRFEGAILDRICEKKQYDVVRSCTYTYQQIDEKYSLNSILANGVEICVKNNECMKVS